MYAMSHIVYAESLQPNTQTKKRRCPHGMSSTQAKMERRVRAGMKLMKTKPQSKKREAAGLPVLLRPIRGVPIRAVGHPSLFTFVYIGLRVR
jgi:hypothetical protein